MQWGYHKSLPLSSYHQGSKCCRLGEGDCLLHKRYQVLLYDCYLFTYLLLFAQHYKDQPVKNQHKGKTFSLAAKMPMFYIRVPRFASWPWPWLLTPANNTGGGNE